MPFKLEKSGNGYFVVDDKGKKYSEKPLPKKRATAQLRALYANSPEASEKKEVSATPTAVMAQGQRSLFGGTSLGGAKKKLAIIAKKEKAIDFIPPKSVVDNAKYGVTLKENNIAPGTGMANVRAESLLEGEAQEPGTIYRMAVYFDRNRKNKDDDRVSWLMMGGDAADEWTHNLVEELKDVRREKQIILDEFDAYSSPVMNATMLPESAWAEEYEGEEYLEDEEEEYFDDEYAEIAPELDEIELEEEGIEISEAVPETGVMVAFFVPEEYIDDLSACVPNPVNPEAMHITLAYLGDINDGTLDKAEVISALGKFVNNKGACISGSTNGFGRFHGKDGELDAIYANFDSPELPEFRQHLVKCLSENGVEYSQLHGYTPHITLSYIGLDDETPDVHVPDMNMKFDTLYLAWGDEYIPFKLPPKAVYAVKEFVKNLLHVRSKAHKMKKEKDGTHPLAHYLVVEDPDKTNTWHLPVYTTDGELDHNRMGAGWAALHEGFRGQKYSGPQKGKAIEKLRKLYEQEGMQVPGEEEEVSEEKKEFRKNVITAVKELDESHSDNTVTVYKQSDGKYRWITISSNGFRDRDGEIVSTKALMEDCDRADTEKEYGPLRWWHIPGVDIGDCDYNMVHGHMLIESGTFRDPEIGMRVKEEQTGLEISIGFTHPSTEPDRDGVFNQIRRFERSLVPKGRVSNRFTSLVAFDAKA